MPVQLRVGATIFIMFWVMGFVLGRFLNVSKNGSIGRVIQVKGAFRWLFGNRPTKGPVPIDGFAFQLTGITILVINVVLGLIWPNLDFKLILGGAACIILPSVYWWANRI